MKNVITTEKIPIKMWLDDLEDHALEQAKNLANLPFAFKHVALMPDSHMGYGMPIGGVLATKNVVIPNAVGVDIGCGMCAVRSSLKHLSKVSLLKIVNKIKEVMPVGFKHQKEKQSDWINCEERSYLTNACSHFIVSSEYERSLYQLGTLGGGNHFIEIQQGSDGNIWIMIHSGSRNLGKKVADHYNKIAKNLNELWFSKIDSADQLAFLPLSTQPAQDYMKEMQYCVDFALENRLLMMDRIMESIYDEFSDDIYFYEPINIAHNYARLENHFGSNVVVHRKGATSAKRMEVGIIPGSQGTKSYIVKGLGNSESFESCSHGAGRKMGRKQATKELNLKEELSKMNHAGILHNIESEKDLDEAPGAYKDIDVVMENQKDLVEIVIELKPLAVIKG
jgi:tRNA-splicing ligase RtcB